MNMDKRLFAVIVVIAATAIGGLVIYLLPATSPAPPPAVEPRADPKADPGSHAKQAREAEIKARFDQAVIMLHAKRYDYAVKALHRVLELAPKMPEAHVNMGYALLGMEDYKAAADFFNTAIELRPQQVNAYYGLAVAHEGMGDLELAIGAMRSYIHLNKDAQDPHLTKARAALWEWEDRIKHPKASRPKGFVPGSKNADPAAFRTLPPQAVKPSPASTSNAR